MRDLVRKDGTKIEAEVVMNATCVSDYIVNYAKRRTGADIIVMETRENGI